MRFEFINHEEHIIFSNYDHEYFSIDLLKGSNANTFVVTSSIDDTWRYEFKSSESTDYDRVKFVVMETVFECDNEEEMLQMLSETFEDGFGGILVNE